MQVPPDHCEVASNTQWATKGAASRSWKHASQCREGKMVDENERDVRWGKRVQRNGKHRTSLKEQLGKVGVPPVPARQAQCGWIKNPNDDKFCHVTMWRQSDQRCSFVGSLRRKLKCSLQTVMFLNRYDRRGLNANDASIWRLGTVKLLAAATATARAATFWATLARQESRAARRL